MHKPKDIPSVHKSVSLCGFPDFYSTILRAAKVKMRSKYKILNRKQIVAVNNEVNCYRVATVNQLVLIQNFQGKTMTILLQMRL